MSTADKLTYLNNTKSLLKDRLNSLGAEITSSTTFRNYLTWLDTFYGDASNKTGLSTNGIVGRTSQETTTGKNLLTLASIYDKSQYGISGTYNTDGSYTISGKGTQSGNAQITQNAPLVLDAGTYTFSIDHALSKKIYLHIKLSDSSYKNISLEAGETSVTDTLSLASTEYNFRYVIAADEVVNETIKMQLESGSSATSWEKFTFGASPNPDYPQQINNLSGNVSYKVSGKNLLDKSKSDVGHFITEFGYLGTDEAGMVSDYIEITPNTDYYISGRTAWNSIALFDSSKTFVERINMSSSNVLLNVSNTNVKYIRINASAVNNDTLMLEKGTTATTYEPYIEPQTFNIPLGDIELCDIDTYEDKIYSSDGRFYLNKNIGKVVLNGSENWLFEGSATTPSNRTICRFDLLYAPASNNYYSDKFIYNSSTSNRIVMFENNNRPYFSIDNTIADINTSDTNNEKLNKIISWVSTHNIIVYYPLITPTTTDITSSNYPELYAALQEVQDYITSYKINKEFILGYSSPSIEY